MINERKKSPSWLKSLMVILITIVVIITIFGNNTGIDESKAFIIAKDFVEDNLKAPSTADFSGEYSYSKTGNTFTITSQVDAQNSFGAMLRMDWIVRLTYNSGDWADKNNWSLNYISIN